MGPPAPLPDMWTRGLLQPERGQARHRAFPRRADIPSRARLSGAKSGCGATSMRWSTTRPRTGIARGPTSADSGSVRFDPSRRQREVLDVPGKDRSVEVVRRGGDECVGEVQRAARRHAPHGASVRRSRPRQAQAGRTRVAERRVARSRRPSGRTPEATSQSAISLMSGVIGAFEESIELGSRGGIIAQDIDEKRRIEDDSHRDALPTPCPEPHALPRAAAPGPIRRPVPMSRTPGYSSAVMIPRTASNARRSFSRLTLVRMASSTKALRPRGPARSSTSAIRSGGRDRFVAVRMAMRTVLRIPGRVVKQRS